MPAERHGHRRLHAWLAGLSFLGFLSLVGAGVSADPTRDRDLSPEFRHLLAHELSFTPADLASLAGGKVIKRTLDSNVAGEVAAVGAVRVIASKEKFIEAYRDIERFKSGPGILQIGRFSDPPEPGDLAPLTIGSEDADLRDCRVGDCGIRLPAAAIRRFQQEIDWTAPGAHERAASLYKEILLDAVRGYVSGGPGRIAEYDDDKEPIRPMDDFAGLLDNSPFVGRLVPGLPGHLQAFPDKPLPSGEDFLYWSKEKFGFAPFISVTHVTITHDASGNDVLTSRDVYSSRYVDASLTVTVASNAVGQPGTFYLVYINRSRANALKGLFGGIRRAIVERRTKGALEENLQRVKSRLEGQPQR
jgi:hypothetical protein